MTNADVIGRVKALVDELGTMEDAAEIASLLQSEGITGFRCISDRCPVSNYLKSKVDGITLDVSPFRANVYHRLDGGWMEGDTVTLPNVVQVFIAEFDNGFYPELTFTEGASA